MKKNPHIKQNSQSLLKKRFMTDKLRYPIGKFIFDEKIDFFHHIEILKNFPEKLNKLVKDFSETKYHTAYRPDGWTAQQVIHHIADSHTNAFIRLKLALTEENPTIKPYFENLWAEQIDYQNTPIRISLAMIESVHFRMVTLFENMKKEDFQRTYFHPEHQKTFSLHFLLAMYAWHTLHHFGHLEIIKKMD